MKFSEAQTKGSSATSRTGYEGSVRGCRGVPLLFMDISNSRTKYATGTLSRLSARKTAPTRDLTQAWFKSLARETQAQKLIVSSVVPRKNLWQKAFSGVLQVSCELELGFTFSYPKPETIGADRLANCAGALLHLRPPFVVADFGTAITFDILNSRGAFTGGIIAPGLNTLNEALPGKAAQLSAPPLKTKAPTIGKSTASALQSGTRLAFEGLVRHSVSEIRSTPGSRRLPILCTGGDGRLATGIIGPGASFHPLLTLQGLQIIASLNS